jgi:hypothetical protein
MLTSYKFRAGQNKWAASLSPILGLACALIAWLVTAKRECGNLGVECTGSNNPMLAGNVAALLAPIPLIAIFTLIFGLDKYDWKSMMAIRRGDDHDITASAGLGEALEEIPSGEDNAEESSSAAFEEERKKLTRAGKISKTATVVMTLAFLVLWPMPMYGSGYIFSKPFFTGWVTVGIIWIFCSFIGVGLFPVFESRATLARTARNIYRDLTGRSHPRTIHAQQVAGEGSKAPTPGDATPTNEKEGGKEVVGAA